MAQGFSPDVPIPTDMTKSKLATWIIAAFVVLGASGAFAETEMPSVDDAEQLPAEGGDGSGELEEGDGSGEDGEGEDGEDGEVVQAPEGDEGDDDGDGTAKDNHGAVVSAAAHDHSYDEACGNHGKVVSAVAKTGELPECATGGEPATASSDTGDKGGEKAAAKGGKKGAKGSKGSKGRKK